MVDNSVATIRSVVQGVLGVATTEAALVGGGFMVAGIPGTPVLTLIVLLLGRGVNIPMLIILIGAIGGMVAGGIIGMFVGAVVLAIAYQLFLDWMDQDSPTEIKETK